MNFMKLAMDEARFVTEAVYTIDEAKGLPIRNCQPHEKLNTTLLSGMEKDLDFAWPNWPQENFKLQSALEQEWSEYASCFMGFMNKIWKDEKAFFKQVLAWYTEFQFAEQLKMYRVRPGSIIYVDRLYHALWAASENRGKPVIDCTASKPKYGRSEIQLKRVAVCFNATTLEAVECGNLYGGKKGSCPKTKPVSFPYPLPRNRSESIRYSFHLSDGSGTEEAIFNITFTNFFEQKHDIIVMMLLVVIICFVGFLHIKK